MITACLEVKSAVQALPAIALEISILKKSLLMSINHLCQVVLISRETSAGLFNVAGHKLLPHVAVLSHIEPHHAAVDHGQVATL